MAKPITVQYEQSRAFDASDYLILTIDGVPQPDRVRIWGPERARIGYGFGPYGVDSLYGFGQSLGYGQGRYGEGAYAEGQENGSHTTQNAFVAGDYTVSATSYDGKGNAGETSPQITIQHRPKPPKPRNLQISGGNLTWTWSDP